MNFGMVWQALPKKRQVIHVDLYRDMCFGYVDHATFYFNFNCMYTAKSQYWLHKALGDQLYIIITPNYVCKETVKHSSSYV